MTLDQRVPLKQHVARGMNTCHCLFYNSKQCCDCSVFINIFVVSQSFLPCWNGVSSAMRPRVCVHLLCSVQTRVCIFLVSFLIFSYYGSTMNNTASNCDGLCAGVIVGSLFIQIYMIYCSIYFIYLHGCFISWILLSIRFTSGDTVHMYPWVCLYDFECMCCRFMNCMSLFLKPGFTVVLVPRFLSHAT